MTRLSGSFIAATPRSWVGAAAIAALCGASALAATAAAPGSSEIQVRYEQERSRCLAGQSGQPQETCLTEAAAARDAAKRNQLNDGDVKYRKNAKERCDALSGDDKRDCIARVKSAPNTTQSGSVKGGGIVKETVTREVDPPPQAASAAPR
jgi:hypothetical protein